MAAMSGSRTEANLLCAFTSETIANRRCMALAARAEAEGHCRAAALFRDIAALRVAQAQGHLDWLEASGAATDQGPRGTVAHLRIAIAAEWREFGERYPGMIRLAREEGFDQIAAWLEAVAAGDRAHAERFEQALRTLI
jgi:rubrerythrin